MVIYLFVRCALYALVCILTIAKIYSQKLKKNVQN